MMPTYDHRARPAHPHVAGRVPGVRRIWWLAHGDLRDGQQPRGRRGRAALVAVVLTALVALLAFAAPAAVAQEADPCDVNPDAPECNVSIFEVQPAGPETCPAGGWVFIVLGAPYPVCNGAPGAAGAPGAPGAPAPPNPAAVVQQVINTPVISPAQPAGCFSRRRFDVSIPQRFRWGTRVKVIVGGETQHDGGVPSTFVRQNHRVRVDLRARPCGVYAVVVTKRGKTPWARLYTAGPNGNMTGYNLAMARAASRCVEDDPCWTWSRMGNRTRGVITKDGVRRVVGPCRFRRLYYAHRIDWTRTPHLRGDFWATRTGCHL